MQNLGCRLEFKLKECKLRKLIILSVRGIRCKLLIPSCNQNEY